MYRTVEENRESVTVWLNTVLAGFFAVAAWFAVEEWRWLYAIIGFCVGAFFVSVPYQLSLIHHELSVARRAREISESRKDDPGAG